MTKILPTKLGFDPSREEIEALAGRVALTFCPKGKVDPLRIAAGKGITVSFNDYGRAFDGMLEVLDGRFHIYCNTTRTGKPESPRSLFTLAHELGHWFLDAHRRALVERASAPHGSLCQWESPLLCERQADAFAAGLLAPAERFKTAARRVEPGLAGIGKLAEAMGLSLTAAAIRFAQLTDTPCAVIKWSRNGSAWNHVSQALSAGGLGRPIGDINLLPGDTPTRRAMDGSGKGEIFEAGTTAASWFGAVSPGSPRDILLLEQALSLGRYGALTFLRGWGSQAKRLHKAKV